MKDINPHSGLNGITDLFNLEGTEQWINDLFPKTKEGHRAVRAVVSIDQKTLLMTGGIIITSILIYKYA